jgi:hypothetical protein
VRPSRLILRTDAGATLRLRSDAWRTRMVAV